MAEEKTKPKMEEKKEVKAEKVEAKMEEKKEAKPVENKEKMEEKKEAKPDKKETPKVTKKEEAIAKGVNLRASVKHLMYVSRFIKNKTIDSAISDLNDVLKFKRPVPFKGEIPHRKYPGVMSGRYPIAAIKELIPVLKGLKGNAIANQMDLEKTRISYSSPTWASRPARKGGARFKRAFILLKAREIEAKEAKK